MLYIVKSSISSYISHIIWYEIDEYMVCHLIGYLWVERFNELDCRVHFTGTYYFSYLGFRTFRGLFEGLNSFLGGQKFGIEIVLYCKRFWVAQISSQSEFVRGIHSSHKLICIVDHRVTKWILNQLSLLTHLELVTCGIQGPNSYP